MSTYQWRGRVLVAGALCALLTVPAGAVNALGVAGMGATAVGGAMQGMLANGTIKDPFSADDAQPVGFGGLEKRVAENNMTIKVLERQLAGIGNTDIDGQFAGQEFSAEMMLSQAQGALAQAQEELKAAEEAGDAAGIAAATAAVHIKVLGKLFRSIFFFNSILAYIMKSGRSQGVFRLLFGLE